MGMVDKWEPTATDIDGNRLPGFGVTTNIINGGLECNIPGNAAVEDRVKYYERYAEILGVPRGQTCTAGTRGPSGRMPALPWRVQATNRHLAAGLPQVSSASTKRAARAPTWGRRLARERSGASSAQRPRPARAGPRIPYLRRLQEAQVQPKVVVHLRRHQQDMPGHRRRRGLGRG